MKKTLLKVFAALLAAFSLLTIVSCNQDTDPTGLWESATYTTDATVGEGEKTITLDVIAMGKTVTLTIKTDKETLGGALYENGIINDASFFDTCNGIKADWNADGAYWIFKKDGKTLNYGVNDQMISGGERFTLEYSTQSLF